MRYFLILIYIFFSQSIEAQVAGVVIDTDTGIPLIGASIVMFPDSISTVTNSKGRFSLQAKETKINHVLCISYIGYKADTILLEEHSNNKYLKIRLSSDDQMLETIVVTEEHAKLEATLQTEHVYEDFIHTNLEGNFSKTLEKLPGLNAINVGVGIAKPVIRGLSANRVIVNHQGIKQESQQWGSDHGLEIDQFDVDRLEIIKGPGSLQYGSDGLGGVINILPSAILTKNSFKGSVMSLYKSNNNHWGGSVKLGVNVNDWFITSRYTKQGFGDYKVPSNLFTYNGFELPIINNRLKNTAGQESNLSISGGVKRNWGISRILYSHYALRAGLFSGAVGAPRSYALEDDGNYRDIDVPSQNVDHYKLFLNQSFFIGEDHLVFDIGFQRNVRQELSQPEFHSIPLSQLKDPNDKLALQLVLETFSVGSHYEHQHQLGMKTIIGANIQWQNNQRTGYEYLLPNFNTFRGGIYSILEKQITSNWLVNGGLRLDIGSNDTEYFRQFIWDSNENIIDSLVSPKTEENYTNWSASIGTNIILNDTKWIFKANLGKSFRVPYPSETVSNGIHHGTFRHEVGTVDLKSEHGYQLDVSADWNYSRFKGNCSFYFNYFDNYIYLGPTFPAQFSRLPEAGQIFQYRQDDAIYTGLELQWEWIFNAHISLNQSFDFVQSYNPKTGLALPFTPPPSLKTDLHFETSKGSWFKDAYFEFSHQLFFAASGNYRIDRSEKPTDSYQLFGIGLGNIFKINNQDVNFKFKVQNLLNTSYLAHLSRYRIIEVPEQGRNFVFTLKIPFSSAK